MSIQGVLDKMAADSRIKVHAGATLHEVRSCEKSLGCRFPGAYREFLLRFGWAEIGGMALFGLGVDAGPGENVQRMTAVLRGWEDVEWPSELIPIMATGNGDYFCLRLSAANDDASTIECWYHELDECDLCGSSFAEWLARTLDDKDLVPPRSV